MYESWTHALYRMKTWNIRRYKDEYVKLMYVNIKGCKQIECSLSRL